jgi:ABC-type Mn2+/Zn2+ transport system permease subunit
MDALSLFAFPFMQRALFAGVLVGAGLALFGVFALARKLSFFGEGIAHASLAGIAVAVLGGLSPLPVAMVWSVLVAYLLYRAERSTRLPSDAALGILFSASMALGVVIMSYTRGYQPDLLSYLFGSILSVRTQDLGPMALATLVPIAWLIRNRRELTDMSLNEEAAFVRGVNTERMALLFYICLALVTVVAVKLLGIVLVSALLIIPAATSRTLAGTFFGYLWGALIVAELSVIGGLIVATLLDWPAGATVVLVGTVLFFISNLIHRLSR